MLSCIPTRRKSQVVFREFQQKSGSAGKGESKRKHEQYVKAALTK
jgi:hypothetical protein